MGAEFEELQMTGTASISVQGNNLDNYVVGNSGDKLFQPAGGKRHHHRRRRQRHHRHVHRSTSSPGNDWVVGGAGIDQVDYDGYAKSGLVANLATWQVTGGGRWRVGQRDPRKHRALHRRRLRRRYHR